MRGGLRERVALADRVEPWLQAFVHRPAGLSTVAASGALAGVAVGVKDIFDTADMPTECGSASMRGRRPEKDAAIVARLRALGATVLGKTVTTEFAWRQPGPTVNPWDRRRTPGGSSSGSAAAVAAGLVDLALGTQTVGSVIRPAAFCGVVGFKPSFGVLPRAGVHPLSPSLDHVGLFARRVEDVSVAMQSLACLEAAQGVAPRLVVVRGLREALVSRAQGEVLDEAVRRLREAGAVVTDAALPEAFASVWDRLHCVLAFEAACIFGCRLEGVGEMLRALIASGRSIAADAYGAARVAQDELRAESEVLLKGWDALVTVPAPGIAPLGLADTGDATFCAPWSFTGMPAVTVPAGLSEGLPLGIQLVGRFGSDARLLAVAEWAQSKLPAKDSGDPNAPRLAGCGAAPRSFSALRK